MLARKSRFGPTNNILITKSVQKKMGMPISPLVQFVKVHWIENVYLLNGGVGLHLMTQPNLTKTKVESHWD